MRTTRGWLATDSWLVILGGIWMIIAPWIRMGTAANSWNDWIMGVVFAILGFSIVAAKPAPGWLTGLGGVWLFIAGFISGLEVMPGLAWNDVLVGIGALILGIWALSIDRKVEATATSADLRHAA